LVLLDFNPRLSQSRYRFASGTFRSQCEKISKNTSTKINNKYRTRAAAAFGQLLLVLLDMKAFCFCMRCAPALHIPLTEARSPFLSPMAAHVNLCLGEARLGALYVLGPCTAWKHTREQRERARAKRKPQRHTAGSRYEWTYIYLCALWP
jgi:hypothetical protein